MIIRNADKAALLTSEHTAGQRRLIAHDLPDPAAALPPLACALVTVTRALSPLVAIFIAWLAESAGETSSSSAIPACDSIMSSERFFSRWRVADRTWDWIRLHRAARCR
jgi:hypothetical protein